MARVRLRRVLSSELRTPPGRGTALWAFGCVHQSASCQRISPQTADPPNSTTKAPRRRRQTSEGDPMRWWHPVPKHNEVKGAGHRSSPSRRGPCVLRHSILSCMEADDQELMPFNSKYTGAARCGRSGAAGRSPRQFWEGDTVLGFQAIPTSLLV